MAIAVPITVIIPRIINSTSNINIAFISIGLLSRNFSALLCLGV